jgi:hypothetical protein
MTYWRLAAETAAQQTSIIQSSHDAVIGSTLQHVITSWNLARSGCTGTRRANAYVRKPVKFSAFAKAVIAIGVFWLFLSEPIPDAISYAQPATP